MNRRRILQEQRARCIDQMEGLANGPVPLTPQRRIKFANLKHQIDQIDREIENIDQSTGHGRHAAISDFSTDGMSVEEIRDRFRLSPAARRERMATPEDKAFSNYLRYGDRVNAEDAEVLRIRNAQSTLVGSQGGNLVPQGFSKMLMEALRWFGGIDGIVGSIDTETGNVMPYPTINDTTNMGRVIGQNVQAVETDFAFGTVDFNAYILSSDIVLIPIALLQDSYFDLDALCARLLGIRLGRLLNNQATIGSGSGTLTGIVPAVVNSGNGFQLSSGNTAAISYANLVALEHSVDPAYRYNPSSRWMFSDTMLKLLKQLVDGNNRPLWQPGISASFREGAVVDLGADRPTILNHQYIVNQDMAAPAANACSMLFGDLSTFMVRKVAGGISVMRLVERYADYLQVGFQAFMRADSQLVDAGTHPIAYLQQSAS
jgi:HK97 family phage major capsid protein